VRRPKPIPPPIDITGMSLMDAKLAIASAFIENLRGVDGRHSSYCSCLGVCHPPTYGHTPPCTFRLLLQQWDEINKP